MKVLFRVAAGPRVGYGHLVRAVSLARALRVRPVVALHGGTAAAGVAARLGCRVLSGRSTSSIGRVQPDVLVIDDPSGARARTWCRAAWRRGIRVASVHDLGIGWCGADLIIDGSIIFAGRKSCATATADDKVAHGFSRASQLLLGPRYSILNRAVARRRTSRRSGVLVALGGGPRRAALARLASEIAHTSDVEIRIAGGFSDVLPAFRLARLPASAKATARPPKRVRSIAREGGKPGSTLDRIRWLPPRRGLARELTRCAVALVGGGVTLYEACALGTPAVALAVVSAQRPTIAGFARRGAVVDAGRLDGVSSRRRSAQAVNRLLRASDARRALATRARAHVDGRGGMRVAAAIRRLASSDVLPGLPPSRAIDRTRFGGRAVALAEAGSRARASLKAGSTFRTSPNS